MLNTKVDYEGFQNTSFVDRSPLVSSSSSNNFTPAGSNSATKSSSNNSNRGDDGFQDSNAAEQEEDQFEFDASEIGGVIYENYEEYTGQPSQPS